MVSQEDRASLGAARLKQRKPYRLERGVIEVEMEGKKYGKYN